MHTIRAGGVDAVFIDSGSGEGVFMFSGADRSYRLMVGGMAGGAFTYFKAVSVDFDDTPADGLVAPYMPAAPGEANTRGIRVILVNGRIMSELRAVFPQVDDYVDMVVAENGALLAAPVGRP